MVKQPKISISILLVCFLTPILITPWFNFDPITLPRLALISTVAFYQFPFLFNQIRARKHLGEKLFKLSEASTWIYLFIFCGILTLLFSPKSKLLQVMGTDSRNAGFLAFFSISLIWLSIALSGNLKIRNLVLYGMFFGGMMNLVYGLIQVLGWDPIDWNNPYGPIIGFFGNPNFMSAYMGLFTNLIVAILLFKEKLGFKERALLSLVILLSFLIILRTQSIQGLIVVAIGLYFTLIMRFFSLTSRKSLISLSLLSISLAAVGTLGFLGSGPFSSFLYQSTLKVRFFYWESALEMIKSKPVFGYGFDSFGTWYTAFRSDASTQIHGPGLVSDSAHNLFLDLGVSGGIPLLTSYLVIQLLILKKAMNLFADGVKVSWQYKAVFTAWIGFQAQSLISPVQLAILFLGFILGAALVLGDPAKESGIKNQKSIYSGRSRQKTLLSLVLSAPIIYFSLIFLSNDHNFRASVVAGEGNALRNAALAWPLSERRLVISSRIFYANDYNELGKEIALKALEINSNNLDLLRILVNDSAIKSFEKRKYEEKILGLDPYGSEARALQDGN
jgi:O-antigen ligase